MGETFAKFPFGVFYILFNIILVLSRWQMTVIPVMSFIFPEGQEDSSIRNPIS